MSDYPEALVEKCMNDLLDCAVNPLANIMCNFLAFQVGKGVISKEEAIYQIASSADVINLSDADDQAREFGGRMLMRMIEAINQMEIEKQ